MQSKEITDNLITASSQYGPGQYEPQNARLWGSRAWSTANADTDPWIQINFVLTVTILEILTQGRQGTNQWVKNYKVAFAQETNSFEFYRDDSGDEKVKLPELGTGGSKIVRKRNRIKLTGPISLNIF